MSQNFKKKIVKIISNKSKPFNKTTLKKKTPITPTCCKCGKVGHYLKDRKLESKINSLETSDKLKYLLIELMINK